MHFPKYLRHGAMTAALLGAALSSSALTLGRSRGVALLGRPLDFTVSVTLDEVADEAGLCPEADVFQGDSRVDPSRVVVRLEPGSGRDAVLRLRSSAVVEEPVVTVYLRLGCVQKITRRYVLLAEQPGEIAAAQAAVLPFVAAGIAAAPAPAAAVAIPAGPPAPARARPAGSATQRKVASVAAAASSDQGSPAAAAQRAPARARRTAALPHRIPPVQASRLKIDLLEPAPEAQARLKSSAGLAGSLDATPRQRADAAALWRAIQAEPADVLRDSRRVQAMEADIKGLRDLARETDKSLAEVRENLEKARSDRSIAIGAAAAVALALLAAAGFLAWRLRRGAERGPYRDWWRRQESFAGDGLGDDSVPHPSRGLDGGAVDVDLGLDESVFEGLKPAHPNPGSGARDSRRSEPPLFQHSLPAGLRMVKAEELVDIQQQAEFFMSLGQVDQAIEVLRSHIQNNVETSALVWLDLLDIYQQLQRRDEYEALRVDFQHVFNAQVPGFDSPRTGSKGLEGYPKALSRIVALWPSPKVLDIIEESIFRKPGMAGGEPFDLEAYRELVMLYNVGKEEIMGGEGAGMLNEDWTTSQPPPNSFASTSMHPLSGTLEFSHSVPPTAEIQLPRGSPRLGLDIDLTAVDLDFPPIVTSGNMVDFELFDPAADPGGAKPKKG